MALLLLWVLLPGRRKNTKGLKTWWMSASAVLERVAAAYAAAVCQTDPKLPKRVRRKLSLVFHPDKGGDAAPVPARAPGV